MERQAISCPLRQSLLNGKIFYEIMEIAELKQKPKEELLKILQDSRERLRQLKFDLSSGKVKNIREIRQIKKDVARILTLFSQKHV